MILAPAFAIVAGPPMRGAMPGTTLWWPPRRGVARRMATPEELAGLGSFLKKAAGVVSKIAAAPIKLISPKLASNLQKIDNKVINAVDKVATKVNDAAKSVGKAVAKNWKWIAIVAAIAITIYTMGAGSTIAAKMLSGMKVLAAKVGIGTAATAATTGTSVATGVAAAAGGTSATATAVSSIGWGKLAMSAGTALLAGAKVSALSQQQAQAVLEAQNAGVEMGASDAQLLQALQQRASIPGGGIPTDAQGNPLTDGPAILATTGIPAAPAAAQTPSAFASITSSPYFVPAAFGAGALLLFLALRR
ncbi:MAG TPA: hypothetical protein VJ549_00495 [Geothrix sp.]|nr:hypothetical protein [Geothrix sp.]HJV47726.1 hypothetical protein [Geothrix sp.]